MFRRIINKYFSPRSRSAHEKLMRKTWDRYSDKNAAFFIATEGKPLDQEFEWDMDAFFEQGKTELEDKLLRDIELPVEKFSTMTVLEIGCGIGRQTRAFATLFNRVIALDISKNMLTNAKQFLADFNNVSFVLGNGSDLSGVQDDSVDMVYSFVVFQHITDISITRNYIKEAARVLRPGGHFIFQVRDLSFAETSSDVWSGSDLNEEQIRQLASTFMLESVAFFGNNTHYLWAHLKKISN